MAQKRATCPFRPLFSRIIVREIEAETRTPGGIVLPDRAKETQIRRGTVVAVGPGQYNDRWQEYTSMSVSVGDVVQYSALDSLVLEKDGEKWSVLAVEG